jgi:sugar-specific transcriptional regulator TrmB/predicted transcriptional regulator
LSEKDISKFLQNYGLSKREIQVYMFLAKSGVQSTSFVAKRLKMERVQAYRTFKKLQEKGLIEATLERPTRFTIVPFESLLSTFIEAKRSEVKNLSEQRESLLASWQTVSSPEVEYPVAKYSVITGKKKIYSKMLSMISEAKKGVFILTTGLGIIHEDLAGILDAVVYSARKQKTPFRLLTDITSDNSAVIEGIYKKTSSEGTDVECRHLLFGSRTFPRFMIKDDEEAILYASSADESSMLNLEDEGLWINDRMFISVLKAFYTQMWQGSIDAKLRIEELKTGTPIGETLIIKDPSVAWERIAKALETAKTNVVAINSSQSINILCEKDPFKEHLKQGLEFRVMAPIDLDNLEAAKLLSSRYKVKHVPINYLNLMIVDNRILFMFKSPPLDELSGDTFFHLPDTFYTTDSKYVERVREMLIDTWKRGTEINEISTQAGIEVPRVKVPTTETLANLVNTMLKDDVNSVMITEGNTPVGLLNERDLLREVIERHGDPTKIMVRDLAYTPLITMERDKSIKDVLGSMRAKHIKRAAVLKDGQLVGMLVQEPEGKDKTAPKKT